MGKAFKKAVRGIGRVVGGAMRVASPLAGLIPGVGPLAAAGLGVGGRLIGRALSGQRTFGDLGGTLAAGAAGGLGSAALGRQGFGGLGNLGRNLLRTGIGRAVKKAYTTPEGELDLGRVAATGLGAANFLGTRAQRRSAERQDAAQAALRNQLMSRVLSAPSYNFNPEP